MGKYDIQTITAINKSFQIAIALALTLGLAPFRPEPHVWGKLKWILGGANGMGLIDWFDFLMHASPWFYLFYLLVMKLKRK